MFNILFSDNMDLKLVFICLSFTTVQCHAGGYGTNDNYNPFVPQNGYDWDTDALLTDFPTISLPDIPNLLDDLTDTADMITGELKTIKTCIPPIQFGLVVTPFKRSYDDGEKITLSCKEGYELAGVQNTSTCKGYAFLQDYGTFMPAVGPTTCIKIPKCTALIQEGLVVEPFKMFYEIGETISISCMEGYTLAEEEVLTCSRDKNDYYSQMMYYSFSGGAKFLLKGMQACQRIRDCPLPIYSGLIVEPFQPFYKKGEEITLSCAEGYDLVASNKSKCDETGAFDMQIDSGVEVSPVGYFSISRSTIPCKKKVTCRPPFHQGMEVTPSKSSYFAGETITILCKTGYEMTGPSTTTCTEINADFFDILDSNPVGDFRPAIYYNTCKRLPRCFSPLRKGMEIVPKQTYYELGEIITISCSEGFELTSDVTTRTCTKNGFIEYHRIATAGFKPSIETSICRKKPSCRAPIQLGIVLSPKKRAYDVGEVVEISCAEGYELKRTNQSLCKASTSMEWNLDGAQFGEFSPQIDSKVCEKIRSCRPPVREGLTIEPNKGYYRIGEKISLSCEDGYELRVAPMSTCRSSGSFFSKLSKEGKFDPQITWDACRKPTVCELPKEDNLIVTPLKETYHEGEEIVLSCARGYSLISLKSMMCGRAAFCRGKEGVTGCFFPGVSKGICKEKPKCSVPNKEKGLVLTPMKETYYEGEEVTLSCKEGYELIGPSTSKCKANSIDLSNYSMFISYSLNAGKNTFSPAIRNPCKKIFDPQNGMTTEDEEEYEPETEVENGMAEDETYEVPEAETENESEIETEGDDEDAADTVSEEDWPVEYPGGEEKTEELPPNVKNGLEKEAVFIMEP
uniref:sushi, von Willebrand factor type A, EGF and pentraxin domain-containing protein 1-like n=1 Tax=Styela clava TaxID=7725 RepID=UPI00193A65E6|nr:sushi, von Willebrand factor type A, EGF and pentraxin domain-containing protein 1-like [Styela clava]